MAQVTASDTAVSRSDSAISKRVKLAATNEFTPWFVGEILRCIVRCSSSASKEKGKFTFKDEDAWFMSMSELGDVFEGNE